MVNVTLSPKSPNKRSSSETPRWGSYPFNPPPPLYMPLHTINTICIHNTKYLYILSLCFFYIFSSKSKHRYIVDNKWSCFYKCIIAFASVFPKSLSVDNNIFSVHLQLVALGETDQRGWVIFRDTFLIVSGTSL